MDEINTNEWLINNIFTFYVKNRQSIDEDYNLAEDDTISTMYYDISDDARIPGIFAKTSIVLLTANKYEKNILHQKLYADLNYNKKKISRILIDLSTANSQYSKVYAYCFNWDNYTILHIHSNVTGSYTVGGVADAVRWVLENQFLLPSAIVSFGICFGTKEDKTHLGDVIISKKVYPYFIGAKINGKELSVVDDNIFRLNDLLYNKVNSLLTDNAFSKFTFQTKLDNYITGEAVVSSSSFRDMFIHITKQNILAGDMEGYGLYKECNSRSYKVPCITIKSICDWGKEKNINSDNICVQSAFQTALNAEHYQADTAYEILKTLKDRLQAYSAGCAFKVLKVFIKFNVFPNSIIDTVREWIYSINGSATTFQNIKKKIIKFVDESKYGYVVTEKYVYRVLTILENEGVISCQYDSYNENTNDPIIYSEMDATITIHTSVDKEGSLN